MKIEKLLIGGMFMVSMIAIAQTEPYRDSSLSADERARDLLSRMTLEEKISQLNNNSPAVERLGIRSYNWWNEALHGVGRAGVATVFPQAIGMAATFDPDAVEKTFEMISTEQRAKYNEGIRNNLSNQYRGLTVWTPNINIFRDPRWGRGQETYGEDPWLTTVMGLAVVKGLQGANEDSRYDKLHACAKHFAVHSGPEWNRHSFDASQISGRDLWETYLPAFKSLVMEGGVKEVMCAYNRFEGEPCCANKQLLKKILREDWGFDDIVVSDCGAISDFFKPYPKGHETHLSYKEAAADAMLSGNDLECVGMSFWKMKDAVESGLIAESDIDQSVLRLLRARFELGNLFDDELTPWWNYGTDSIATPGHRRQAVEMANKSMVLLKNSNILPLHNGIRKIAVVGPNANDSVMMWGNYNGIPASSVTILQGIREEFPSAEVKYVKGCNTADDQVMFSKFSCFSIDGKPGMKATYYNNTDLSGEPIAYDFYANPLNFDTKGATVYAPGVPLSNFSARYRGEFVPEESEELSFYIKADDGYRLFVNGEEIKGDWKNGGKQEIAIPYKFEKGETYDVVLEYYQAGGGANLKFDVGFKKEVDYAGVAESVADADVIIFAGGISPSVEGEEMGVKYDGFRNGDRTKIELPAVQENLMKALKSTGKPLVFVICGGGSFAIPWEAENCDAILEAFYPGESGGTAVAQTLSGKNNPAGRLPFTFYSSTSDLPDFEDYDMDGRTYRYFEGETIYPFGHGLSYTTFDYGSPRLSKNKIKLGEGVSLKIPVTNTGAYDGEEVVQVYVKALDVAGSPIKSLKAFKRLPIKKGQTMNVTFVLSPEVFSLYDYTDETMKIHKGRYEILYGGSSDETLLKRLPLEIR